jgi:hypothetical protein
MRESSLFAPALVKQDAVSPAEGVGASDVEGRVVDKVQIRDGRWRGRDVRESFVEECCVCKRESAGAGRQGRSGPKRRGERETNPIRACKKSRRRHSHMIRHPQRNARFLAIGVPAWRAFSGKQIVGTSSAQSAAELERCKGKTHKDVGVGQRPDMTLFPVDTGEQMLQFGVDFEDRLERQTGVAVLVVIERVDLVMPHESADRESVLFVVVVVQVSSFIVREA